MSAIASSNAYNIIYFNYLFGKTAGFGRVVKHFVVEH
jgi:hypothetical protein